MKKLLWVGDAACPSGFAKATHEILDTLCNMYDVTVLGINYRGDPHSYPYKIYVAAVGGDFMGVGRLVWMCDLVKPDIIVIQNDGWNIPAYVRKLRAKGPDGKFAFYEYADVPVVAVVPVDGKNFNPYWLDGVTHTIFWTEWAQDEARAAGFDGESSVIPLGVDLSTYRPMPKKEARQLRQLPDALLDKFIVGNVNRNQPRKRWDLTLKYFAEWIHGGKPLVLRRDPDSMKIKDAFLFLHVAPTGDMGIDIKQLAAYYRILSRLILVEPPTWYGVPEEEMALTYNCFDVAVSTTQGEGFGLTALEAMACGIPVVLPDWAALGDWAKDAAWMIPCTGTAIGPPYQNVIGGVADESQFVNALAALYQYSEYRETNSKAALERASQDRFRWAKIGEAYESLLSQILTSKTRETVCEA